MFLNYNHFRLFQKIVSDLKGQNVKYNPHHECEIIIIIIYLFIFFFFGGGGVGGIYNARLWEKTVRVSAIIWSASRQNTRIEVYFRNELVHVPFSNLSLELTRSPG